MTEEAKTLAQQEAALKTIVFDLDNTICSGDKVGDSHFFKKPVKPIIDEINRLHSLGYKIVIETSRGMYTNGNNESAVIAKHGEDTLRWLRENHVMYDMIKFGKSYGNLYIDDKAIRPSELLELGLEKCFEIAKNEKRLAEERS